jgi:hypothetical protein
VTVTSAAIVIVRSAIVRYTSVWTIVLEVVERRLLDDHPRELVELPEGGDEQHEQRAQIGDDQPAQRAGEQQPHLQAAVAEEEVGEPPAHRPPLDGGGAQPLISVQACTHWE